MKSHPEHKDLENYHIDIRKSLSSLIQNLVHCTADEFEGNLEAILKILPQNSTAARIIILDELIDYFHSVRCSKGSDLAEYLQLLNHLPISRSHKEWKNLEKHILEDCPNTEDAWDKFQLIQLLYLLTEMDDKHNPQKIIALLEGRICPNELRLMVLYSISYTKFLLIHGEQDSLIRHWLSMIHNCYLNDGVELCIYLIVRWLSSLDLQYNLPFKREMLLKLSDVTGHSKCQNSALILYELFDINDKIVSPTDKFAYFKRLIKHQTNMLTVFQLQELYFFAGNYPGNDDHHFKESIVYYQHSNYYLYKCWDQLRIISQFLRDNMTAEQYFMVIPQIEEHVQALGNRISFQNNAYVETLQADYNKIEMLYKQVEELSLTDSLTGLRNRRYLENNIFHMVHLATRHQVPISFAMIDIDHFKLVNDNYGHAAGDYVLKRLAMLITKDFRKSDVIVRYGGEEFLMLLFDTTIEQALRILEEVRISVQKYDFVFRNQQIPITISIGISNNSVFVQKELPISEKIAEADKALYRAKNSGRNRISLYD